MGDAVDAWNDGGWWVGRVTSVPVASAGVAAASPRRGSGRRKDHGPPAAQPPLRVLLAGSGEDLQAQQVRMQLVGSVLSLSVVELCAPRSAAVLLMKLVRQRINYFEISVCVAPALSVFRRLTCGQPWSGLAASGCPRRPLRSLPLLLLRRLAAAA